MKPSSTSVMENIGAMYAVVRPAYSKYPFEYLIYKLDSVEGAEKDDVHELGQPIESLNSSDYPHGMKVFSVGSKVYFIGGKRCKKGTLYFTSEAYMFDINSNKGTVPIASMNFPKPVSFVFGPIDDHKVYLFSPSNSRVGGPSFEILDTVTNTWRSLKLPEYFSGLIFQASSALCGSSILLYESFRPLLHVFCIKSETWRCQSYEDESLQLLRAHYLYPDENIGHHILLASPFLSYPPGVYSSPILSPVKNDNLYYYCAGPFQYRGEVKGLKETLKDMNDFLGGWGEMLDFFCFNNNSISIVRAAEVGTYYRYDNFVVDVFTFSHCLIEGTVKVKVEKNLQYKYTSKIPMMPMHFLVVA